LAGLRAVYDSILEIYALGHEPDAAGLRLAVVVGASLPERREFVAAMQQAGRVIRDAGPLDDELTRITRVLAAALRATIAAALIGELPLGALREYADGILIGERERKQLGVAAMKPSLDAD
jgi:hypothetical protein